MNAPRVLDLFSGIGGFSLGLERAGMKAVAFCEIDPFCRRVLAKHWPEVPCYEDVRTLDAGRLQDDGIVPDVLCGGFPCQDISVAGKGAGINGARSGLWAEYARLIGELRPDYVIVENVSALLVRGLDRVLGDMASLGYDAEWHCIPASAVGAPHRRDRVWIIAHDAERRRRDAKIEVERVGRADRAPRATGGLLRSLADSEGGSRRIRAEEWEEVFNAGGCSETMANPVSERLEGRPIFARYIAAELAAIERSRKALSDADGARCSQSLRAGEAICRTREGQPARSECRRRHTWLIEPDVGRVADGVPARVDRLRSLGNAVVSQIPELIGRAIMEARAA